MVIFSLAACVRPMDNDVVWRANSTQAAGLAEGAQSNSPAPTQKAFMAPTRRPNDPILTPTPDQPHQLPTRRSTEENYTVQRGDTLGKIAQLYGVDLNSIITANNISDPDLLKVGQTLTIPVPNPLPPGPDFKIIPDSELVYGPAAVGFDVQQFVASQKGYLANFSEEMEGNISNAAGIIIRVSQQYSVNPRLLLAVLEYRSGWVTHPDPDASSRDYPIGFINSAYKGLYMQLSWAANNLNRGYYLWKAGGVSGWILADGSLVPPATTINAGTAGIQHFFSLLDKQTEWVKDVMPAGLFATYQSLFGYPFDYAVEPLIPPGLQQPAMQLPFEKGAVWSFTGGPHGGWGSGSAWAAIDFAPPGDALGCVQNDAWVTAVVGGRILRAQNGEVIEDLDGDGFEQTGWVILYMHTETRDRVKIGTLVKPGDRIGHPSCEGGVSNGTHVHLARRYNGEWISADGSLPFQLDGWSSKGDGVEYDGWLVRGSQTVEAWDARRDENQISR
jgi:LasA protease